MVGVAEQPDLGDPDGKGAATFHLRKGQGQVCFTLAAQNIAAATAAHIHKGAADGSGPVYVALATPGSAGTSSGCVAAPRVIVNDILTNKTSYYVNVHNADFANGAIRGQLQRPTTIPILTAPMLGVNEKPNAGDSDGAGIGNFLLNPDKSQLCYTLRPRTSSCRPPGRTSTAATRPSRDRSSSRSPNPSATGTSSACVTVDAGAAARDHREPGWVLREHPLDRVPRRRRARAASDGDVRGVGGEGRAGRPSPVTGRPASAVAGHPEGADGGGVHAEEQDALPAHRAPVEHDAGRRGSSRRPSRPAPPGGT